MRANEIKELLAARAEEVARYLLPKGKRVGSEWRCGDVSGSPGKSLGVHLTGEKAGIWKDFATDEGGDLLDLWQAVRGVDFKTALHEAAEYLGLNTQQNARQKVRSTRQKVRSTPPKARQTPPEGKDGENRFTYTDANGRPVIYVIRETTEKGKSFKQWGPAPDGKGWIPSLKHAPKPRPLYRLPAILRHEGPVILHEGEKAVVAACKAKLAGIHTTTLGGAGNARHTDFSPLQGRDVVVVPDNDAPGERHAQQVAELAHEAGARLVKILHLPGLPPKGDVVEWLAAGGTPEEWDALLRKARRLMFPALPGFRCTAQGVFQVPDDGDAVQLTLSPVFVEAMTRDENSENWGRLVVWHDADGNEHREAIRAESFHATSTELAQYLAARGLRIVPGRERRLIQYLAAFNPDARMLAATRTGWHGKAFVLPHIVVNQPEGEQLVFQPEERRLDRCFAQSDSFEAWREGIADAPDEVRFAIAAALAAPLLERAGLQCAGVHFYGLTSTGKTTLLQLAASVWGNGGDPATIGGANAYIQRWNATANGLEGMAASFNDLPLIIDEIGEADGKHFGRVIYQLASGTGKSRATRTGALARRRAWRLLILSVGEMAVADFIRQAEGRAAKGGMLVRLIDVPVGRIFSDAEAVRAAKRLAAEHFGWAGPAFVEVADPRGWQQHDIGEATTPEQMRVRDLFKLIAHAGEQAIKHGIVPWPRGSGLAVARKLFAAWQRSALTEADVGIRNVRAFILTNKARFEGAQIEVGGHASRVVHHRAGVYRDGVWHFVPEVFAEACNGANPEVVKQALREKGLLVHEPGRLQNRVVIDGRRVRVVSVRGEILEWTTCPTGGPQVGAENIVEKSTNGPPAPPKNAKVENDPTASGHLAEVTLADGRRLKDLPVVREVEL